MNEGTSIDGFSLIFWRHPGVEKT